MLLLNLTNLAVRPDATINKSEPSEIAGAVFYRFRGGNSLRLSATEVSLIAKPSFPEKVSLALFEGDALNDLGWEMKAPILQRDGGIQFFRKVENMLAGVRDELKRFPSTFTDAEGRFHFPIPSPGNYFLYAELNTASAKGYWLQEINVAGTKRFEIDLSNQNLRKVYEISDR